MTFVLPPADYLLCSYCMQPHARSVQRTWGVDWGHGGGVAPNASEGRSWAAQYIDERLREGLATNFAYANLLYACVFAVATDRLGNPYQGSAAGTGTLAGDFDRKVDEILVEIDPLFTEVLERESCAVVQPGTWKLCSKVLDGVIDRGVLCRPGDLLDLVVFLGNEIVAQKAKLNSRTTTSSLREHKEGRGTLMKGEREAFVSIDGLLSRLALAPPAIQWADPETGHTCVSHAPWAGRLCAQPNALIAGKLLRAHVPDHDLRPVLARAVRGLHKGEVAHAIQIAWNDLVREAAMRGRSSFEPAWTAVCILLIAALQELGQDDLDGWSNTGPREPFMTLYGDAVADLLDDVKAGVFRGHAGTLAGRAREIALMSRPAKAAATRTDPTSAPEIIARVAKANVGRVVTYEELQSAYLKENGRNLKNIHGAASDAVKRYKPQLEKSVDPEGNKGVEWVTDAT